jgi:pyruvate/2-oxoacid:ferredoxin oxidoreductase beta subunit
MDITDSTKALIDKVQTLKDDHADTVSPAFIDFYCQCRQGMDYLFPEGVKETVRLLDILQWFCDCVDQGEPSTLIQLMWKDVVGPSWAEYRADEIVENKLMELFEHGDLKEKIRQWDLERRADGGVNLTLRTLLDEIHQIEMNPPSAA